MNKKVSRWHFCPRNPRNIKGIGTSAKGRGKNFLLNPRSEQCASQLRIKESREAKGERGVLRNRHHGTVRRGGEPEEAGAAPENIQRGHPHKERGGLDAESIRLQEGTKSNPGIKN